MACSQKACVWMRKLLMVMARPFLSHEISQWEDIERTVKTFHNVTLQSLTVIQSSQAASPVPGYDLQPRSAFGHSGGGVTAVFSVLYTIRLSETHKGNLTLP